MTRRIASIPTVIMGVGTILLLGVNRQQPVPLRTSLATLPVEIAGFMGTDRKIDIAEERNAGMSEYLFRDYAGTFSVYAAYYDRQTRGRTIHSPRNCLPGAGWEPIEVSDQQIPLAGRTIPVRRYLLGKGSRRAVVYYWYQGRGRVTADEYRVKWELLRDAALRGRTEEALVRIVAPVPGDAGGGGPGRLAAADSLAIRVVATVIPALDRALPAFP